VIVRRLAIQQSQVKADVQVGENQWGGAVLVQVSLPRKSKEVSDALVALENLLLRTAQEHIKTSGDRETIRRQVDEKVKATLDYERGRIVKETEERTARDLAYKSSEITERDRRIARLEDHNGRLQRDLEAALLLQAKEQEKP